MSKEELDQNWKRFYKRDVSDLMLKHYPNLLVRGGWRGKIEMRTSIKESKSKFKEYWNHSDTLNRDGVEKENNELRKIIDEKNKEINKKANLVKLREATYIAKK